MKFYFVTSKGLISKIIRAFEGGRSSHVAIGINNRIYDSTLLHGVKSWSEEEFSAKHTIQDIIELDLSMEDLALCFLLDQVGKSYDWTALIGFLLWRDWTKPDKWYCSELALAVIQNGSSYSLADKHNRVGVRLLHELVNAWRQ